MWDFVLTQIIGYSPLGGPMAVPFAIGDDSWALVDPEPSTNELKDQIVPVGDNLIVLMLLGLAYGFVIFRRRK